MTRISYFLVMVSVIVMLVGMEAGEAKSFSCDGPEKKQSLANCLAFVTAPQLQEPSAACCMAYKNFVETAKTTGESFVFTFVLELMKYQLIEKILMLSKRNADSFTIYGCSMQWRSRPSNLVGANILNNSDDARGR